MIKKFFGLMLILCMLLSAKSFAAEFELVSYSAHVKLQWLSFTGQPEAKQIIKEIGKANIYGHRNLLDYDRLEKVNSIYQEICYLATVQYVRQHDYKNILDMGGGYTPRAMVFAKDGRKYFGGELMAVAVSADNVMKKIVEPKYKQNIMYDEILAEDKDAFKAAANVLGKNICVVEQGLMIYLNQDRLAAMCENIDTILRSNGGCFITSDLFTRNLFKDIAAALYGEDQTQLLYDETKDMYEELFDSLINEENFDYQYEALEYAKDELGWKVEQVPLITNVNELHCLSNLTDEQAEKIKKIAAKKYLSVVTVNK